MENNDLNKLRFFAQYWGLNCFDNPDYAWRSNETLDNVLSIYNGDLSKWYAKLKPLSNISDEDLFLAGKIELADEYDASVSDEEVLKYAKHELLSTSIFFQNTCDFLRSKGYLIPFMELQEKELIEYGWVKLQETA